MTPVSLTGRTIAQVAVGDAMEITREVTEEVVAAFLGSVGDQNPIHADPGFAATTRFERPIAPGLWTAGLISAVIGTYLPGPGALYASQTLKFLRPVYVGDVITARVEVAEIVPERHRIRLATVCRNQRGEEVLSGEAWVLPPPQPIHYTRPPAG